LDVATDVAEGKELTAEDRKAYVRHGAIRYRQGYTVPLLIREARLLQASLADCIQRNFTAIEMNYLVPIRFILWAQSMLCWRTLHADSFSKRTLKGHPVVAVREERRSPNQMPKRVKGRSELIGETREAAN